MAEKASLHNALNTYVHLGPDGTAIPLPVTETFWQDLTSGAFDHHGPGRLVSTYRFNADWNGWEKHPAGEEFIVLLQGSIEFVLEVNGRHEHVTLHAPGEFTLVPRDTWHTANVAKEAMVLFVTAGDGTQHRPRD